MKERPTAEGRGWCGAASVSLRCAGLRSATAALRGVTAAVYAVGRTAEGHRQIGGGMAFLPLGEKQAVATMIFPAKEATQMSYEVKYIGKDVHKETIVSPLHNASGEVGIEWLSETKAT